MADDARGAAAAPSHEPTKIETTEDAETRATRRELKQSTLSDQPATVEGNSTTDASRPDTPSVDTLGEKGDDAKEQVSSPKKKRARDQIDGNRDLQDNDSTSVASTDSAKDRAARLEPEKKRHRDEDTAEATLMPQSSNTNPGEVQPQGRSLSPSKPSSADAFASSGFGKLASNASGFAALGGSSKATGLSSTKPSSSPNSSATEAKADPSPPASAPKLSFGSKSALSPFAGLASGPNGFGTSAFALGSSLSGTKPLGGFGVSGAIFPQSDKAAKPFGAPDSDADDGKDEEEDGDIDRQVEDGERDASPDKDFDDKKRPKLHKIEIDDGEAGEVTVVSVRAKIFSLDKQSGWKERGAGMLKLNVPHACIDFDDAGAIIPGSFEASGSEAGEEPSEIGSADRKVARLILRQDQTHRVILNTAILPAMEFQEKASLKSVGILFTALEGPDAKPMSAASSKLFLNEVNAIQRELRRNTD